MNFEENGGMSEVEMFGEVQIKSELFFTHPKTYLLNKASTNKTFDRGFTKDSITI
jgi:hypothetical protein